MFNTYHKALVIFGIIFCLFLSVFAQSANDTGKLSIVPDSNVVAIPKNENYSTATQKIRQLIAGPWQKDSFEEGISLLSNQKLPVESREMLLGKIASKRQSLNIMEIKKLLEKSTFIAKDSNEPARISGKAIEVMANISGMMYERGDITREESIREKQFLMELISDEGRDLQIRGSAIRAIGILRITEASLLLKEILSDPNNIDTPEIAKNGCLSLLRINEGESFENINHVLTETNNLSIFLTAVYCMGRLNSEESLSSLLQNKNRFPDSGAVDFALVDMDDVILDVLNQPNSPILIYAIKATKYLWREEQKQYYMPLLYQLLETAPIQGRKVVVQRLLDETGKLKFEDKKTELRRILSKIENDSELQEYVVDIKERLSAKKLTPVPTNIRVPIDR